MFASITPKQLVENFFCSIDVRVFSEYCKGHIPEAFHANIHSLMLKRAIKNDNIISLINEKCRKIFVTKFPKRIDTISSETATHFASNIVVIYDKSSTNMDDSAGKSFAEALVKYGCYVYILAGGYDAFVAAYPDMPVIEKIETQFRPEHRAIKHFATQPLFSNGPSKILDYIYLGNKEDSMDRAKLIELGITHIINVTTDIPNTFEKDSTFKYLQIAINDICSQRIVDYFDVAIKFIESARESNGIVFIHCAAGISRSPTIVMAYLIKMHHMTTDSSFSFVKLRRSIVNPNMGFMCELLQFQSMVKT